MFKSRNKNNNLRIEFPLGFPWEGCSEFCLGFPRVRVSSRDFPESIDQSDSSSLGLHQIIMKTQNDLVRNDERSLNPQKSETRVSEQKNKNTMTEESVGEDEEAVVWVDEGEDEEEARLALGVVGKIWTDRHINVNAFMSTMKNVWQPASGVDISNIGPNTYVFQFHHWRDKQRVMERQPWHFDNHAIILGDITGNTKPSDMELWELPMWVRVYNLPFKGRLNVMNVEAIGNKLGSFIKLDNSGSMGIDKSIRIRVNVDVRKPLYKHVKVKMRGGIEEFFDVKYERPPIFCYFCGKIGHGLKDCHACRDEETPRLGFGGWLKASPWKRNLMEEEKVAGNDGKQTCARNLFITKPKSPTAHQVGQQVNEVIESLQACEIQKETGQGGGAEWQVGTGVGGQQENETEVLMKQGGVEIEVGQKGDEEEKYSSTQEDMTENNVIAEICYEGSDLIMTEHKANKGWKRIPRRGKGEGKVTQVGGGFKRKGSEVKDGVPDEVEKKVKKQKGEESEKQMMEAHVDAENKVAGPTNWALGCQ